MVEAALVATLGTESQVITLLLDALLEQGHDIRRVIALHTDRNNPVITSAIERLETEFQDKNIYSRRIAYESRVFVDAEGPMVDIVTEEDIDEAYTQIYQLLQRLKREQIQIHLCISGGRKTMSVVAMAAAQPHFDQSDRLWHVISSDELVKSRAMHTNDSDALQLVRVPFHNWQSNPQEDAAERARVERAITELTDRQRQIVKMFVSEGWTTREVANHFDISPKTVSEHLYQAYPRLEAKLQMGVINRMSMIAALGKYSYLL